MRGSAGFETTPYGLVEFRRGYKLQLVIDADETHTAAVKLVIRGETFRGSVYFVRRNSQNVR
jgi:hypothetical protein